MLCLIINLKPPTGTAFFFFFKYLLLGILLQKMISGCRGMSWWQWEEVAVLLWVLAGVTRCPLPCLVSGIYMAWVPKVLPALTQCQHLSWHPSPSESQLHPPSSLFSWVPTAPQAHCLAYIPAVSPLPCWVNIGTSGSFPVWDAS